MTDEAQTFSETGGEPSPPATENVSTNSVPSDKGPFAFRTISAVADELHVPQHTLRLWETQFHQVRPLKRGGGRRYYRPADIELLRHIADLLYTQGYTVKGVQWILQNGGVPAAEASAPETVQQDRSKKQPETAVEAVEPPEVAPEEAKIVENSSEKVVAVDDNVSTIQPEPEPEPEPTAVAEDIQGAADMSPEMADAVVTFASVEPHPHMTELVEQNHQLRQDLADVLVELEDFRKKLVS